MKYLFLLENFSAKLFFHMIREWKKPPILMFQYQLVQCIKILPYENIDAIALIRENRTSSDMGHLDWKWTKEKCWDRITNDFSYPSSERRQVWTREKDSVLTTREHWNNWAVFLVRDIQKSLMFQVYVDIMYL